MQRVLAGDNVHFMDATERTEAVNDVMLCYVSRQASYEQAMYGHGSSGDADFAAATRKSSRLGFI